MTLAFLFGAFGAIVAEVLKRWQQWNDMPENRFRALFKSLKFWSITVFLILLGGTVGCFEGSKTTPIDWSLCFFVGIGAMSTVRNFLSGLAAQEAKHARESKRYNTENANLTSLPKGITQEEREKIVKAIEGLEKYAKQMEKTDIKPMTHRNGPLTELERALEEHAEAERIKRVRSETNPGETGQKQAPDPETKVTFQEICN